MLIRWGCGILIVNLYTGSGAQGDWTELQAQSGGGEARQERGRLSGAGGRQDRDLSCEWPPVYHILPRKLPVYHTPSSVNFCIPHPFLGNLPMCHTPSSVIFLCHIPSSVIFLYIPRCILYATPPSPVWLPPCHTPNGPPGLHEGSADSGCRWLGWRGPVHSAA